MNKDITLLLGDCIELMKNIPEKSIDLILCDMPYGTTKNRWDTVLPLDKLWNEYKRISRGAIILAAQTPFDKLLGASNLPMLRYEWIWEKTHPTGHLNAKRAPMKAHENLLVFYDRQPTYNPIKTSGHKRISATRRHNGEDSTTYGMQNFSSLEYDSTERYPRSVITFASDKQRIALHPTQKPVALMEYMIRTYTNERDLVLDNCMGSGTTGVACINTNRRFIGIEKDEKYFEIASNRINEALSNHEANKI